MSSQAARDLVGAVGDLEKRCELLLGHLKDVNNLVTGYEDYRPAVEQYIADATTKWASNAMSHVDDVIGAVDEWRRQVLYALEAPNPNRHY